MYNVDSLPPSYYEERLLADHAARLRKQHSAHLAAQAARVSAHLPHCAAQKSSMPCPQNLTLALSQQRPQLASGSGAGAQGSGVLGGIFQGFVKARSSAGSSGASTPGEGSPVTTPRGGGGSGDGRMTREEFDAWHRGRKREMDVGAMPAFYH